MLQMRSTIRMPRALHSRLMEQAGELGYRSLNDYQIALFAAAVGMPEHAPEPRQAVEELPLTA